MEVEFSTQEYSVTLMDPSDFPCKMNCAFMAVDSSYVPEMRLVREL